MDKDEARELNREAKQDRYEEAMNRQCNTIWNILSVHDIESDWKDQFLIAERLNKHGVELDIVDLEDCDSVEDVLDALD